MGLFPINCIILMKYVNSCTWPYNSDCRVDAGTAARRASFSLTLLPELHTQQCDSYSCFNSLQAEPQKMLGVLQDTVLTATCLSHLQGGTESSDPYIFPGVSIQEKYKWHKLVWMIWEAGHNRVHCQSLECLNLVPLWGTYSLLWKLMRYTVDMPTWGLMHSGSSKYSPIK